MLHRTALHRTAPDSTPLHSIHRPGRCRRCAPCSSAVLDSSYTPRCMHIPLYCPLSLRGILRELSNFNAEQSISDVQSHHCQRLKSNHLPAPLLIICGRSKQNKHSNFLVKSNRNFSFEPLRRFSRDCYARLLTLKTGKCSHPFF